MAGPAGILSIFWLSNLQRKYLKKGEHAAMQGSARQDTLFSSLPSDRFRFRLSRGYILFTILMIVYPAISRPIEDLMSLSLDWGVGKIWVMMDWDVGYTGLGICLRIS
jgi:hypothetical protein